MRGGKIVVRQDFGSLKVLSPLRDSPPASSDKCFHNLMFVPFISDKISPSYFHWCLMFKVKIKINITLKFKGHTLRQVIN